MGFINFDRASWKDEASIITTVFFLKFKVRIGLPILPPSFALILFFFKICSITLQVVDFPFVPVTTIDFTFLLVK